MSTTDEPSNESTALPNPIRALNDPLVSCPIVCGEYMRATGFFYRTESTTYLVTARHNLRPTRVSISNPKTGGQLIEYSSGENHSHIDIYLASPDGWECKRIDTRDNLDTRLNQAFNLDVVALRIRFEPENHGYRVWTPECIRDPHNEDDELMTVGFDGASFPESTESYSRRRYRTSIGTPRLVPFENSSKHMTDVEIPHIGIGLDTSAAGNYPGLSGAPVLGDGLVGIHIADDALPDDALTQLDLPHARRLVYFRPSCLQDLLATTTE